MRIKFRKNNTLIKKAVSFIGLTLISVASFAQVPLKPPKKASSDGLYHYSGTVIVSGEAEFRPDDGVSPCYLCFTADKTSSKLIPRISKDSRSGNSWFAFDNSSIKNDIYKIHELTVDMRKCYATMPMTIQITNYKADLAETETIDTAKVVKIIKKGQLKPVKCTDSP